MPKVEIKKDWMRRARERAVLPPEERKRIADFLDPQTNIHSFDVELSDWPIPLWRALLDEAKLLPKTRAVIALYLASADKGILSLTPEEQLALWQALQASPKLTPAQKRLGKLMRGES